MDRNHSGTRTGSRKDTRGDSEGLFDWNLKSDRIRFSPRWLALIECDDHEIGSEPEDWFQRVHPDDHAELLRQIEGARSGHAKGFACRYRLRHKDGTYRWMACRGTVVRDGAGHPTRLTGSQSDVTVEMVSDPLTGLPNRQLLLDRVTHAIERARRHPALHFAVFAIDLGRPASLGSPSASVTNDPLLTAVARRLETCLRNAELMPSLGQNDLVARLEGDSFAILLDGLTRVRDAKVAADRVLDELLNPVQLGGREVRLSAGIGVAVSATGYTTANQMLHDAQVAQHRARMLGGSHCEMFDTAIVKSEQEALQLEHDFAAALQRREFALLFQPIVSLDSNQIVGLETLVRWQHPLLGMIPPNDFIPLAEKTGFIVPLGNWILREACRQFSEWDADLPESRNVSLSVNISGVQAHDASLVDQVAEALRDSGLEPRRLVLELTEGTAIANPTATITLLMRLRALGARISVDDFGTGYSSLAYLHQFPFDTLKIDRSFVRGMITNKDTAEIVAGVLNMAQQLGLHVVAEGIEQEEQCGRLRALKCDAGQGSLFAMPLDADTAAELLKTGLAPRPDRVQTTAAPKDARLAQLVVHAQHLVMNQRAWFAGAALTLLLSGFVVVAGKDPEDQGARPLPVNVEPQQTPMPPPAAAVPMLPTLEVGAGVNPSSLPVAARNNAPPAQAAVAPPTATVPSAPTPRVAKTPSMVTPSTPASAPPPTVIPSTATPIRTAISASPPVVSPTIPTHSTSLHVVHLHRLGSCRGRLDVTHDGVTFVSDTDGEDDAFTLKYAEFLNALSDDTLILKSATRTYRFKAAATGTENKGQLRDLVDTIARSRR